MPDKIVNGIIKNFGYLSLIQIFNFCFPIILYPYLVSVLGNEVYGSLVFVQSIAMYFGLMVNFGFNLYGTDKVSKNFSIKLKLSEVVSTILCIQFLFCLISILGLQLVSKIYSNMNPLTLLLVSYVFINELAVPVWYFQGTQKMNRIAICNLVSKLVSLIVILIFVNGPSDINLVLGAYLLGTLICAFYSWFYIIKSKKVQLYFPDFENIKKVIRESFPLFVSHSLGGVTAKSNAFLIGNFIGVVELSFYDIAEKLTNMISLFFANFSNAVFPVISDNKNSKLVKKSLRLVFLVSLVVVVLVFIFSDFAIKLMFGPEMKQAVFYLKLLSISVIFRAIGPIISSSILVVNGLYNTLSKSFVWVFVSYFTGVFLLYYLDYLTITNLIIVFLVSLLTMMIYRIYIIYKNGLVNWLV